MTAFQEIAGLEGLQRPVAETPTLGPVARIDDEHAIKPISPGRTDLGAPDAGEERVAVTRGSVDDVRI